MFSKSILLNRLLLALLSTLLAALSVGAQTLDLRPDRIDNPTARIKVVYPKPGQKIAAVDSMFIFGNVPAMSASGDSQYVLTVNSRPIPVHRDGGFLAFLPVTPGECAFSLHASLHIVDGSGERVAGSIDTVITIVVPKPLPHIPFDSLTITQEIAPPSGDLIVADGDLVAVQFQGTPGCAAWFGIDSIIDSVPMAESMPRMQPYWGEAVFGSGAVPESLKVSGIYSGYYRLPADKRADSVRIRYYLKPPGWKEMFLRLFADPGQYPDSIKPRIFMYNDSSLARDSSSYRVTVNPAYFPRTVRFVDSVQTIRHAPRKGYYSILQPKGVEVLATGKEGDWYRLEPAPGQIAWAHQASVELLQPGLLPPHSYLTTVRTESHSDHTRVTCALSGRHSFRVVEESPRRIRLTLYGVTSDTDWIRYDVSDPLIDIATWSQSSPDVYELTIALTRDLWGYDVFYEGNTLVLRLKRAPINVGSIRGKRIVIDAGHSKDPGAIGPTGLTEAEANLDLALETERLLRSRGADVIMTRSSSIHVDLARRPAIALEAGADLFVSIHNNALPDGVNPLVNTGTATFYYHPHSIDLARSIHAELTDATGLGDYGLYHGNLAVNRPTQYPAVLVECAFMMVPEQEAMLKTKRFQRHVAKAILRGIERFLERYDDGNDE